MEPATFWLVAQCRNQLHHRVPLYIYIYIYMTISLLSTLVALVVYFPQDCGSWYSVCYWPVSHKGSINTTAVGSSFIFWKIITPVLSCCRLAGGLTSPRTPGSEPLSLTESMQLLDEILSDGRMERLDKIERLEAILSVITSPPSTGGGTESTTACCSCHCHMNISQGTASVKEGG